MSGSDTFSPIPELNLLFALQERLGFEGYAEGFGLADYGGSTIG